MTTRSFRRAHARRIAREGRRLANARRRALVAGATLGASAMFATSAHAAGNVYTVTTSGDDSTPAACDASNNCADLRDAINAANNDGGNDTIQFASNLAGQTITLTSGNALTITAGGITIQNPNAPGLAVSGGGSTQVFVNSAPSGTTTTISGLTVEDGGGNPEFGGAIYTPSQTGGGATLVLSNDVVKDSISGLGGGGVDAFGPLTISNSVITGNQAGVAGGVGAKYPTSITNSVISGNTAKYGGGIVSRDGLLISGSQITGNTLPTGFNSGSGGGDFTYDGSLSITGSTISGNTSGRGGGIFMEDGTLSVTSTTISGNTGNTNGGGIADYSEAGTTLSNLAVSGNTAASGGGIYVAGSSGGDPRAAAREARFKNALSRIAPASVVRKAAVKPQQTTTAGPISIADSTISGNTAPNGAGVDVPYSDAGDPITISASTLSGNSGGSSSFGGGLLLEQNLYSPFELIDSTISGNSATNGGGVSLGGPSSDTSPLVRSGGSIAFDNSTIASNSASASGGGGGIYLSDYMSGSPAAENSATSTIFSTIVARDTAAGTGNDLAQAPGSTSGGFDASYSLIEQPGNAPLLTSQAVIKGVDPQIGALANNGGPTQTMLPAFTSPVIDQGKAAPGLTTDQRGDPRTVTNGKPEPSGGDGTDIGAVELAKIPIVAIIEPATGITAWQSTLNGKITTNAEAVTWHFEYGTTTSYGQVTPSQSISAGNGQLSVLFTIGGLYPHTLYHYRLVAVAANGVTSDSADATFETLTPTIKVSPGSVEIGKQVRVFGAAGGCPVGDSVTLISRAFSPRHKSGGRPAISAAVKSGDTYSVKTTIPKNRDAGRYAIIGRCGSDGFAVTAYLRVLHPKPKAVVRPVSVVKFTG